MTQSKKICKELTKSKPKRFQSEIEIAASGLKSKGVWIGFQWNLQFTVNLRPKLPNSHGADLQPQTETDLDVDLEDAGKCLPVELCKLVAGENHDLLAVELGAEDGGGFVALVERR